MSINLLEILGKEMTGGLAKNAAGFLGESESGITSALGAAFPTILGSLIGKGATKSGAGDLMDMFTKQDTGFMDNIGDLFGGSNTGSGGLLETVMGSGGGLLKMLMGDKVGGIVDIVAKAAGIGNSTSGKLLKMAAPFLIGMVGKYIKKNGLNIGGLMDLLSGQKKYVADALPEGAGGVLGLDNILGLSGSTNNTSSNVSHSEEKKSGGLMKWLLPLLLLLGALYYFFGMSPKDVADKAMDATKEVAAKTVDVAKSAADATVDGAKKAGNMASDAAGAVKDGFGAMFAKVDEAAKTALDALTFKTGSAAYQFKSYIAGGAKGDGLFRFENLNFATGSARIEVASGEQIDNIAAILKAYPGVNIAIEGHTDKTGNADANLKLSQDRANSVRGRLMASGIDAARLTAIGFGSSNPVSATSTNAENRRIEVRIVK